MSNTPNGEKLTPEQEKQLEEVKNEWLSYIFEYKLKFNRKACVDGINWLYEFSGYKHPKIFIVESQLAAQIVYNELLDMTEKERSKVTEEKLNKIANKKISGGFTKKDLKSVTDFSAYGNIWDYGWCSFYDFFSRIGILKNELFQKYLGLIKSGVYDMIQLEEYCIVCKLPIKIHKDANFRLHAEDESAIKWKDGYEVFFWHGIEVPKKLILTPDKITRREVIDEKNVELRRCYQERLGNDRFMDLMDTEVIDEDQDTFGNTMYLYRTREKDNIINDYIYFARVTDPSTGRQYLICVRPGMKNVWEAVASTFGKTKEQYKPLIET